MNTKEVKKTTTISYEPWNQCMHIAKFAENIEKQQKYLKTAGITISEENKLQFYTEQLIDRRMFDKKDIINWEDKIKANKTWIKAKKYFQKLVASEERYASVIGGTSQKAHFKSAA